MKKSAATFQCFAWLLCAAVCPLLSARAEEPPAAAATNSVVLPFQLQRGHIMVPTRMNGSNALSLLLDTGYDMTMLQPALRPRCPRW